MVQVTLYWTASLAHSCLTNLLLWAYIWVGTVSWFCQVFTPIWAHWMLKSCSHLPWVQARLWHNQGFCVLLEFLVHLLTSVHDATVILSGAFGRQNHQSSHRRTLCNIQSKPSQPIVFSGWSELWLIRGYGLQGASQQRAQKIIEKPETM